VGLLGCPVEHRTGPVDCAVRHLRVLCPLCAQARIKCVAVDRWREVVVTPLAHQTVWCDTGHCPVNYSGAASHFPEGGKFSFEFPGAPDTVRWCTGQSGAPDQGAFGLSFALFV
jgi:hypothetical protein